MTKFNLLINPFTRRLLISSRINGIACEAIVEYDLLDEWHSFQLDNKSFDVHIYYEDSIDINIHENKGDEPSFESFPCSLKIVSKDEF